MRFFKTSVSVMLAIAMLASTGLIATAREVVFGDANGDGKVTSRDSLVVRQHIAEYDVRVPDMQAADYDQDGSITAADAMLIRQTVARIINEKAGDAKNPTLPADYAQEENAAISVNQVGYSTDAQKVAKISRSTFTKETFTYYVYDVENQEAVYSNECDTFRPDSNSGNETVYVADFDFSPVKTAGSYVIWGPEGYSYEFVIEENPYQELEDAMVTALYYNRCGTALDESIVGEGYVHDICHTGDNPVTLVNKLDRSEVTYKADGTTVSYTTRYWVESGQAKASDFAGGLHDAGDYGRYTTPANQVVADLLYAYEMYPEALTVDVVTDNAGEKLSDALDEARYEAEWILKMQNPETGGVYFRLCTQAFAGWTEAPDEDASFDTNGLYATHETLKSTAGACGVYAACYRMFKTIDPDFSQRCLEAAKKAYAWVEEHKDDPGAHHIFGESSWRDKETPAFTAGTYGSTNAWSDMWWAACEMFRATGEQKYHDAIQTMYAEQKDKLSLVSITAYDIGGAGTLAYLMADNTDATLRANLMADLVAAADSIKKISDREKYDVVIGAGGWYWGSNQLIGNALKACLAADYLNGTNTYENVIRDNLSFVLGRNVLSQSFVTEFGEKTPYYVHHGPMIAAREEGYDPIPGWIVGGMINTGGTYEDIPNNWDENEVCVYWNSSWIFVLAYIVAADLN